MNRLKLGVVGAGHLGRIHARLLSAMPDVELVGVADPVTAARNQVALEFGAQAFADHRALAPHVEAAVVATPTRLHRDVALELLARGVHLLVEKPLAATLSEADELVRAARRHQVILQVGHVERFNPAMAAALPYLRVPKFIEAVRASGYTGRSTDIGVVLDLMIHDLDLVLSMVRAPIKSIRALGLSVLGRHEDVAHARLEFENGCVANLSASRVSFTEKPRRQMNVWAQQAFAAIDFGDDSAMLVRPSEAVLRRELDLEAIDGSEQAERRHALFHEHLPVEPLLVEKRNKLADELEDFVSSIREKREPRVTGQQARDVMAVAEQILAHIDTHAWTDSIDGPVGPLAAPPLPILRGPHWKSVPEAEPLPRRREAG